MNREQEFLILGILFAILSQVTDKGFFHWLYEALALLSILYVVFLEAFTAYMKRKQSKLPPYALRTEFTFNTIEERDEFGDALRNLLTEMRQKNDPTNGLTPEQLSAVGLQPDGQPKLPEAAMTETLPKRKPITRPGQAKAEIVERYNGGQSVSQIVKEMGYREDSTVYKALRQAKVKLRG